MYGDATGAIVNITTKGIAYALQGFEGNLIFDPLKSVVITFLGGLLFGKKDKAQSLEKELLGSRWQRRFYV